MNERMKKRLLAGPVVARTAEINARESKRDTMRAPPLIASTKGTKKTLGQCHALSRCAFLMDIRIRHCGCFLFQERLGSCVRLDQPAISLIPLPSSGLLNA
jgi:hypothetical protein